MQCAASGRGDRSQNSEDMIRGDSLPACGDGHRKRVQLADIAAIHFSVTADLTRLFGQGRAPDGMARFGLLPPEIDVPGALASCIRS